MTDTETEMANKIIKELEEAGFDRDGIIEVLKMARGKFMRLKLLSNICSN